MGRPCTIYGDQKSIVTILNKRRTMVSLRTEHLIFCLQDYGVKITHISIDKNISHCSCRRHFAYLLENNQYLKEYINFVYKNACSKALTLDDIKQATEKDKTHQKLTYLILKNRWFEI